MLQLHSHPLSTFARRIRIALAEKNVEAELIEVDMVSGAHRKPPYTDLNPYGRVPTMVDDGFVLYESTVILEYLEAKYPKPALVPTGLRERSLVSLHMKLCDLQLTRQTGAIIFPKRFMPKERWDEAAMAQAKKEIDKHLGILERQLEGKEYLVAGQYTLAEVCYTPFVEFFPLMEVTPGPAVAAWSKRLLDRPSAQATKPMM